jgi:hypothetical protein
VPWLSTLTLDARALADVQDRAAAFFGFLDQVATEGAANRVLLLAVEGAGVEFEQAAAELALYTTAHRSVS